MLKIRTTPNLYGVTLMGDYEDLDKLYDSISRYLDFYKDNNEKYLPYHEYEFLLSINYDIRHCYQGDRGFEVVENNSDGYGSMAGVIFEAPEDFKREIDQVHKAHKKGNLYFTVEILYPLIIHYLISFEMILERDVLGSWFETEREFGGKWKESYTMIDAMRDRAHIAHLTALFWDNLQELLGRDKADTIYDYFTGIDYPSPASLYCDALIHCQLVNFESMTTEEKKDFHLATIYEIMGSYYLNTYHETFEDSSKLYGEAVSSVNKKGEVRFPTKNDFYDAMDKTFGVGQSIYQDDFDKFLNDTYGEDPDRFEKGVFNW